MATTSRTAAGPRSRGRGAAAAFGFILLFAGLIGGGVLFVLSRSATARRSRTSPRRRGRKTSLTSTRPGPTTCTRRPQAIPTSRRSVRTVGHARPAVRFEFDGPAHPRLRADTSITYDTDEFTGASVARFEVTESGRYEITVQGDSIESRAAVGRDPSADVDDYRRGPSSSPPSASCWAACCWGWRAGVRSGHRPRRSPRARAGARGPVTAACGRGRRSRPASRRCRSTPTSRTRRRRSHRPRPRCRHARRGAQPRRDRRGARRHPGSGRCTRRRPSRRSGRGRRTCRRRCRD